MKFLIRHTIRPLSLTMGNRNPQKGKGKVVPPPPNTITVDRGFDKEILAVPPPLDRPT